MSKLPKELRQKEMLYRNLILFAAAVVMVVLYFGRIIHYTRLLFGIILPFLVGGILAFILDIISKSIRTTISKVFKIENRDSKKMRTISNIGAILFLFIILAIFIVFILPQILNSIQSILLNLPFAINNIYEWALAATRKTPTIQNWLKDVNDSLFAFESGVNESQSMLGMLASGQIGSILTSIMTVITTTVTTGLSVLIAIMFSIIVLFNKETLIKEGRGLLLAYLPDKQYVQANNAIQIITNTFSSYISGTCLECLILGTLIASSCLILRLPYAFLAGVLVGICALVPMFGAFVGGVISALIIAIQSPVAAIYFMIMFVFIQQIEGNLIYPNVVGKSVGLPPVYIIVAVTVGGNLAGVLGMILLIPISSCLYQLVKAHALARIHEKESQYAE